MADYLQRALQEINSTEGFSATEEDVMVHGLSADGREYTVVLNRGIKGCPKYRLPIKTLPKLEPVAAVEKTAKSKPSESEESPEPETETVWPAVAFLDDTDKEKTTRPKPPPVDYSTRSYRELQQLAKEADIPANQTSEELIAALQEAGNDG